jgi:hypothetical protein
MRNPQHYFNDDKSPLIDLLNCIVCGQAMKIAKSSPAADGMDIIQYRCGRCDRIERVRLVRRNPGLKAKAKLPTLSLPVEHGPPQMTKFCDH